MIFVDTNTFVYAVGRPHPLRDEARAFFVEALSELLPLVTSAEVMQELMHLYLPVRRMEALDQALALVETRMARVWPVEPEDVRLARLLSDAHPELGARDLVHLALCQRREIHKLKTFDRALEAAALRSL